MSSIRSNNNNRGREMKTLPIQPPSTLSSSLLLSSSLSSEIATSSSSNGSGVMTINSKLYKISDTGIVYPNGRQQPMANEWVVDPRHRHIQWDATDKETRVFRVATSGG